MGDDSEHKKYSPSGAKRWMNCPGYLNATAHLPSSPDTEPSMIGTAAHELAASCLTLGNNVSAYKYKVFKFPYPTGGEFTVPVTMLNQEGIQGYVDLCRSLMEGATEVGIEEKLDGSFIDKNLGGTCDFKAGFILDKLIIGDYKNGRWNVDAVENYQLMIYAILALGDNPYMVETVNVFIYQPNSMGAALKSWSISVKDLIKWRDKTLIPAIKATKDPNAPLVPGDWCDWCPLEKDGTCPAILESMFGKPKKGERIPLDCVETIKKKADLEISALTAEELDRGLEFAAIQKKLIAAWEAEAYNRLLAGSPNSPSKFKLVKGKGSRSWEKEETEVKEALKGHLVEELMYDKKFKSVKGIEDALKALDKKPEIIMDGLVKKAYGKSMVPVSDKREAWKPDTAENMFEKLT